MIKWLFICGMLSSIQLKAQPPSVIEMAQQLSYAVKTNKPIDSLITQLENVDLNLLISQLDNDINKKTFWLNIYNAFIQILLKDNPSAYQNRNHFFSKQQIKIANHLFSLDAIEHGILRRSKSKLSFGYFNKLFVSKLEKKLRVNVVDYRIHFALNCGAKSCPPIAFYTTHQLDKQLNLATSVYLKNECVLDSEKNTLYVPKILSWFRADFGGIKGIRKILKSLDIIVGDAHPKIKFKKYDWELLLSQYAD